MEQLLNLILGPLRQAVPPAGGRNGTDSVGGDLTAWLEAVAPGDADTAVVLDHATTPPETASVDEETADHWISVGSVLEREVWAWTGVTGSIAPSVDAAAMPGDEVPTEGEGLAPARSASAAAMPLGEMAGDGQAMDLMSSEDSEAQGGDPRARTAAAGAVPDGDVSSAVTTLVDGDSAQADTMKADTAKADRAGIEAVARSSGTAAAAEASSSGVASVVPGEIQRPQSRHAAERRTIPDALARDGAAPGDEPVVAEDVQRPDPSRQGVTPPGADVTPEGAAPRALADAVTKPGMPSFDVAPPGLALSAETAAAESLRGADPVLQSAAARPGEAVAQAVARQIGGATLWHRQGEIEIALSPEELGRVRMVVTGGERGATVTVFFDRPDVLDLMRRHPEQLMQDLRDSGFADARLDLRDGSTGQRQRSDNPAPQGDAAPPEGAEPPQSLPRPADPARLAARTTAGDRHLDIRL